MKAGIAPPPVITFSEGDMRRAHGDISSNRQIQSREGPDRLKEFGQHLLGLPSASLEVCSRTLSEFASEQVMINGVIELETTFGECGHACSILVLYTMVDIEASYNIIMGRPTLNKLGAVVSMLHLCMKYPIEQEVGRIWANHRVAQRCYKDNLRIGSQPSQAKEPVVNVLDLDLDPLVSPSMRGLLSVKDLKEVNIRPWSTHKTRIGTTLAKEEESRLVSFLWRNKDVFSWSLVDMPRINPKFLCHCLSRKRKLGEEKRRVAREETRKLLVVGFIKEIQYPTWLANIVMVKKASNKWQMCIDYIDLNKACPKDLYPLPNIDLLVDGASGYALLSFMDTYSRYNQIRMHPRDEAKIALITNVGTFCYKVMPFGLNNVGATYQRLMDEIFEEIIGTHLEVYVDDMVVKSTMIGEHYNAL
ncbi:hypothetical protein CR513_42829, partial [Mucuna pruriens]